MAKKEKGSLFRWLSKPESMVGLSAVLISVVAVGVSAYEAALIRSSQRASVWPSIQLNRSMLYEDDEKGERIWTLIFNAENVGVGPALIKDFKVTVDGQPYATWGDAIKAVAEDAEGVAYGQSSINGTTVAVGRTVEMFQMRHPTITREVYETMDGLDFEACFCSIFGECWTVSYKAEQSGMPVKACKPGAHSFSE